MRLSQSRRLATKCVVLRNATPTICWVAAGAIVCGIGCTNDFDQFDVTGASGGGTGGSAGAGTGGSAGDGTGGSAGAATGGSAGAATGGSAGAATGGSGGDGTGGSAGDGTGGSAGDGTGGSAGTAGEGGAGGGPVSCTENGALLWADNGHCYFRLPGGGQSWDRQKTACEAAGAHLVVITSAEEQAFVAPLGDNDHRWIGLFRTGGQDFEWVTGEAFSYTAWLQGEPNEQGDVCVRMRNDTSLWADRSCNDKFAAICERE